jgi:predicted TIM-barrel fold metal-dependent hydrolase
MLLIGAIGATGVSGCIHADPATVSPLPPPAAGAPPMVDGHCHTFNAKDLSAARFIRYAFLEHFPGPQEQFLASGGPDDPDLFDGIIKAVLFLVGAGRAPTVRDEIAYLDRWAQADEAARLDGVEIQATTERLADLLGEPTVDIKDLKKDYRKRGKAYVRTEVLYRVRGWVTGSNEILKAADRRAIAEAFLSGEGEDRVGLASRKLDLLQLFKWLGLFRGYRSAMVDMLARRHLKAGWDPVMIAPAMVDFACFVSQEPEMAIEEQVRVWARIAQRPKGPAVHGYVAYCPLRQAEWRAGRRPGPEPLKIVEDALDRHGFLGVKLYPPMGFQPQGNAKRDFGRYPFSDDVLRHRFGKLPVTQLRARAPQLGGEIDAALGDLYALCERLDAPIMAHGGPANAVKRYYGQLADPYVWLPVFRARPALRVMLAHYGSFKDPTLDPASEGRTKEDVVSRYLRTASGARVFVDMSMFTEAITLKDAARDVVVGKFREFMATGGGGDHMVFGTDWTMLGLQKGEEAYDAEVLRFLGDAGLKGEGVDKVLRRNFMRFAGLERGDATRRRLDAFNAGYGQPDRLARLDA